MVRGLQNVLDMQRRPLIVACLAALCSSACIGKIGDTGASGGTQIASDDSQCTSETPRGASQGALRRLTSFELRATFASVLPSAAFAAVEPLIETYPADIYKESVEELNLGHLSDHVSALFSIATTAAATIVDDDALFEAVAPACLSTNADDICITDFIRSFGGRLVQRALSDDEVADFLSLYEANDEALTDARARFETLLAALLSDPEFVFHVEYSGEYSGDTNRRRVALETLASRIASRTTGALPDAALSAAIADGTLQQPEVVHQHVRRLLDTPAGHARVRAMFSMLVYPGDHGLPDDSVAQQVDMDTNGLDTELEAELLDYVEHVVFTERGTFADLMTSNASFPSTARLATILGTDLSDDAVVTTNRAGLLARPRLLANRGVMANPILRGVFVTKQVLCRTLGPPPANADTVASESAAGIDLSTASSRIVAQTQTASSACSACHAQLNPPGFLLSHFDAFGAFQDVEDVYDPAGTFVTRAAIDDDVAGLLLDNGSLEAAGSDGLGAAIAASSEGRACMARQLFRLTRLQMEASSDSCILAETQDLIATGEPIFDAIAHAIAGDDIFYAGALVQ